MTRKIRLGAFLPGGGQHVASWRHPDQPADGALSFEFHKQLALTAERGLFDAYFLADGLAVGFGGALAIRRAMETQLFGVGALDPLVLSVVTGTLLLVATIACGLPARRAARIDPLIALTDQ